MLKLQIKVAIKRYDRMGENICNPYNIEKTHIHNREKKVQIKSRNTEFKRLEQAHHKTRYQNGS